MKIKITSDSTIDLPQELLDRYGISVMPLHVLLGDRTGEDGVQITPSDIYAYEEASGELPKTAARNATEYGEFFRSFLAAGYDEVIHYSLSSGISASYQEASRAAEMLGHVSVIDTRALSTGTALLALDGASRAAAGDAAQEIVSRAKKRIPSVQTSFIIDKLEYLYKGGRCSKLQLLGSNLLNIKPTIEMHEGKLDVGKKFRGKLLAAAPKYAESVLDAYSTPDLARVFVTHTEMDSEVVDAVIRTVKARAPFREVIETIAGATITSHCGRGTIGILYLNDGALGSDEAKLQ